MLVLACGLRHFETVSPLYHVTNPPILTLSILILKPSYDVRLLVTNEHASALGAACPEGNQEKLEVIQRRRLNLTRKLAHELHIPRQTFRINMDQISSPTIEFSGNLLFCMQVILLCVPHLHVTPLQMMGSRAHTEPPSCAVMHLSSNWGQRHAPSERTKSVFFTQQHNSSSRYGT
jgi:hypothetical protein